MSGDPLSLEAMHGDRQARCIDFFKAYADDLPAPLNRQLINISEALFRVHKRARLGSLFMVSQGAAEATIREAEPEEDAIGWREAIEAQSGMLFNTGYVPASAALALLTAPDAAKVETKVEKRLREGIGTISEEMLATGDIPDDPIDEACFAVFDVDPYNCVVSDPDLSAFTDAVVAQFTSSHGRSNLGAPLIRKCHKQAHKRIRFLPRYGNKLGKDRNIGTMLYNKTVNRVHVPFK